MILARAARSARLTTHFDLDFPRTPQKEPYWCHKHKRECRPIERADHFVRRYTLDTLARLKEFGHVRKRRDAVVLHGDAREVELPGPFDAVVTSPPYPGLIDYHEQHRYAYELLGLDDLREREIGAAARGTSKAALAAYRDGIVGVLAACRAALKPRGRVVIVVNDRRDLYPEILDGAGLVLEQRYQRHVNRRTGRRAGEYFEDVLVARRSGAAALTGDHMVTYDQGVTDDDHVFKALGDPTRRHLLDRLFERDGRTLTELESELEMTRFGVMKHLRVLEDAGLVVTRRQGREKLHFLNPVPIRLIHDRWIDKYAERQVSALSELKTRLEGRR